MPNLHRYAIAGWTARELRVHLGRLLVSRGWTLPGRPADSSDLALEHAYDAAQRASEDYQHQFIVDPPCPHGQPAGHVSSPTRDIRGCPLLPPPPAGADDISARQHLQRPQSDSAHSAPGDRPQT